MINRIFNEKHIELLKKFFTDFSLKDKVEAEINDEYLVKILLLMELKDIKRLEMYYYGLDNKNITEELNKLGFESVIDTSEKKIILNNFLKKKIYDTILRNSMLIKNSDMHFQDEETTKQNIFDGFTDYKQIIKRFDRIEKKARKANKRILSKRIKAKIGPEGVSKTKAYMNVYDPCELRFQFSEANLPTLKDIETITDDNKKSITDDNKKSIIDDNKKSITDDNKKSTNDDNKDNNNIIEVTKDNKDKVEDNEVQDEGKIVAKRKSQYIKKLKVSIKDMLNDKNFILRKKKMLNLDPSGPIDYHGNDVVKFKNIDKKVKKLPLQNFDVEVYKQFNLRSFIETIIYKNNKIKVPTTDKYKTIEDFKSNAKGDWFFFRNFMIRHLIRLIMAQDKYLSFSDAKMIAKEVRHNLKLGDFEYFYNLYHKSGLYHPNSNTKSS